MGVRGEEWRHSLGLHGAEEAGEHAREGLLRGALCLKSRPIKRLTVG